MLDRIKLKKNTTKSNFITFKTHKSAPVEECINPYNPFLGTDGKNYIIGYEERLNTTTNCYAYAVGWRIPAIKKTEDYIPGFLVGLPCSVDNLVNLVKKDLEAVGRQVYEVIYDIPKTLPEGEGYWIKALCCLEKGVEGIHFMRKDKKSGRWIHKMGWEMPPKVCVKNLEFKDKKEALLEMLELKEYSRDMAENILVTMFPKSTYTGQVLTKSEIETDDFSNYIALNEKEEILIFKAMWVMRISDP